MKRTLSAARRTALLALALILILIIGANAESYDAETMRLLRQEGAVEIFDPSGESRFVMENVRFASGEALETGEDGLASVSLDVGRIVTMDAVSRAEFLQEASHMKLTLCRGTIFLDVANKLGDDESLDIQTSTMTVGIRGTIVYVSEDFSEDGQTVNTRLGVLEGTAEIDYVDNTGARRRLAVSAGMEVNISAPAPASGESGQSSGSRESASPGVSPVLSEITHDDIQGFVEREISREETLVRRVTEGSERGAVILDPEASADKPEITSTDWPADGDWVWDEPVTLVAQSASRLFDGTPLTRFSDVLVYGLPEGLDIRVSAGGSQTDAGESENAIADYHIYNGAGQEVTAHFRNIEKVSGVLKVDPAPLTVWTGSAEKYYDGTPLTEPDAALSNAPGYKRGEEPWRNTALVVRTALDSETMIGLCGATWVHGTNPLTGETKEMVLYAGQRLSVCLHSEDEGESLEYPIETLAVEDLPEEVLRVYADNPAMAAQACRDTGWDEKALAERIEALPASPEKTVEENGLLIREADSGNVMRDASNVRINIDTEITNYNTRPLTEEEAHFTPVFVDPDITVRATGSRTEVGESPNTYAIDWGRADPNNYVLSEELGTLTVLAKGTGGPEDEGPVVLTAGSAEKVYDGTPLTDGNVTASGLPKGFSVSAVVEGSQTDAGSAANTITSYRILDKKGSDVTAKFPGAQTVDGTLTVKPLRLDIDVGGGETTYGEGFTPSPALAYGNGAHAGETAAATRLRAMGFLFRFTLFTGDTVDLSIPAAGSEAGTYALEAEAGISSNAPDSYSVSLRNMEVTVKKAELTVVTGSAEKTYDGEPLICEEASLTGLVNGETADVTATGTITDAGETDNTYEISWGTADPDNYTVLEELGTLTVEKLGVVIDLNGGYTTTFTNLRHNPRKATAEYENGDEVTRLSSKRVYEEGGRNPLHYFAEFRLLGTDTAELTSTGEITVGTHRFKNTLTFTSGSGDNYDVSYINDTVTIEPLDVNLYLFPNDYYTYYDDGPRYDAEPWPVDPEVGGYYWMTLEQTGDDTWEASGSIKKEVMFRLTASGGGTDAGTYRVAYSLSFPNVGRENFNIRVYNDEIVVAPAPLTITTPSASKTYDGTPLTADGATVEGLQGGDEITVTVTGSQTDLGSSDNTYTLDWGSTNPDNYRLIEEIGSLDVFTYDAEITITAGSSSRSYNGTVLTDSSFTVDGLPRSFRTEVDIEGEQYLAGTCENVITGYRIYDTDGEDVTENFTNVTTVNGTLEVKLKKVAFWSWPAVYDYDGWYHSATVMPGFIRLQFAAADDVRNSDLNFSFDSYRDVGEHPGTFTASFNDYYGKNLSQKYEIIYQGPDGSEPFATVRIVPRDLTVTTLSDSKVYDGKPLKGTASLSGRGSGDYISVTTDTSITDVGSVTNDSYTIDWGSADPNNYNLIEEFGTLTVTPATLTVVTDSDTKEYDGTPLTAGAHLEGLSDEDDATVTATGTITEEGSVTNTYEIDWGTTDPDNYVIVEKLGVLSVTNGGPAPLTVITDSGTKTYDGTPLTADARLVGLNHLADAKVIATGTITHAGSAVNTYTIDWGSTDPADYTITEQLGTLTVTPAPLTVKTGSKEKTYDGQPLTSGEASLEGLIDGDTATVTAAGSLTKAGTAENTYAIVWDTAKAEDYAVTAKTGTLTVHRRTLYISTGSAWKYYDGKPLTCSDADHDNLASGETITVKATGSQTEVGYSVNTYEIIWGATDPDNYEIDDDHLGWLDVYDPSEPSPGPEEPELLYSSPILLSAAPKAAAAVPGPEGSDGTGPEEKEEAEPEVREEAEPEVREEAEPEVREEAEPEVKEEAEPEVREEAEPEVKEEAEPEVKEEAEPEVKEEPKAEEKEEPKAEEKEEPKAEEKEEPKAEVKEEPKAEVKEEPKAEVKEEAVPSGSADDRTDP